MKIKNLLIKKSLQISGIALVVLGMSHSVNAQSASDSLTTVMNVDSGVVNIDTTVVIHNSLLTIEGGDVKTGQLEIGVAKGFNDLMKGAGEGDIVIGAKGGGSSQTTATNLWGCAGPKIITHANNIQFWLDPCYVPNGCPFNVFDVMNMDKNGLTINTQFIDPACAWLGSTTINGPTNQNGNLKINGSTTQNGNITVKGTLSVCDQQGYEFFKVNAADNKVYAREINVQTATFPDYVFAPNYALMSLNSLEQFIHVNKHLPEMPTAEKMENDGMNISELNTLLTKKVEELSLYLIAMNKRIIELESKEKN